MKQKILDTFTQFKAHPIRTSIKSWVSLVISNTFFGGIAGAGIGIYNEIPNTIKLCKQGDTSLALDKLAEATVNSAYQFSKETCVATIALPVTLPLFINKKISQFSAEKKANRSFAEIEISRASAQENIGRNK